jgi:GNAT superfamily N-acetyltransferase
MFVFEIFPLAQYHSENEYKVNVRIAQSSDISFLKHNFAKFKGEKADKRLNLGHLCFVAEKNGNIVHYTWVAFEEIHLKKLNRKLQMESDAAYIYDVYTLPEYRGRGISSTVYAKIFEYLLEKGFKRAYCLISSNNYPSLRVAEKTGLRNIGEITLIGFFKLRKSIFKSKTFEDYMKLKKMFSF